MTAKHIYAYSVGHFFNDLSATIWMTYFVIYLSDIQQIDPKS